MLVSTRMFWLTHTLTPIQIIFLLIILHRPTYTHIYTHRLSLIRTHISIHTRTQTHNRIYTYAHIQKFIPTIIHQQRILSTVLRSITSSPTQSFTLTVCSGIYTCFLIFFVQDFQLSFNLHNNHSVVLQSNFSTNISYQ